MRDRFLWLMRNVLRAKLWCPLLRLSPEAQGPQVIDSTLLVTLQTAQEGAQAPQGLLARSGLGRFGPKKQTVLEAFCTGATLWGYARWRSGRERCGPRWARP